MHLFRVHMLVGTERMLQMQSKHAVLAQPIRASFQVPDHRFGEHVRVMPLTAVARVYEPAAIVLLGIDDVTNRVRKIRFDLVPEFDHGHQYSPCTVSISAFSRSIPVIFLINRGEQIMQFTHLLRAHGACQIRNPGDLIHVHADAVELGLEHLRIARQRH